jgi:hypothetical protein
MGFFAVLKDPDDPSGAFEVKECHVNLWVLRGLLARRSFVWDVGLHISASLGAFSKFQIALPSGSPSDGMTDLHDRLLTARVGELIFGQPVNITNGSTIDYGRGPLLLSRVPPSQAARDGNISNTGFTLWTLKVATPVARGTSTYLRIRFRSNGISRVWDWKSFLFSRYAALVDIRFSDIREAWNVIDGESLKDRIEPIQGLNFFLVVPSSFHMVSASPPLHYIRILEGKAWEAYLGRRVSLFGTEKLSIYQWRNKPQEPVSTKNPMRVYIDLEKQLGALSVPNRLALLFVVFAVCAVAVTTAPTIAWGLRASESLAYGFVRRHAIGISVGATFVILSKLFAKLEAIRKILRWISDKFNEVESWLFRVS